MAEAWTGHRLTQVFLEHTGAAGLDDLVEGVYLQRFRSNRPWC